MIETLVPDDTAAYDAIMHRKEARFALFQQEDLMEELTGEDLPYADDLSTAWKFWLWVIAAIFALMAICGFVANPIAGFCFAGLLSLLWAFMVNCAKEISASEDGAGNMYRNQKIGRSPAWSKQREQRTEIVEQIVSHESPVDLLNNLDDPDYVRTLKEALHRDENGWTMSD
jgi:hypothetical protein